MAVGLGRRRDQSTGRGMNTRQFSRTMQQAFGPHTDNRLHPMRDQEPMRLADKVLYIVSAVCAVGLFAILIFGAQA